MPCLVNKSMILCISPSFRLRLNNGSYVFMSWHSYCGPTFFKDRNANREIEEWWNYSSICKALDWFTGRGNRA